eukprot:scaffold19676_cov95-Skeletonema_dohrnii-CCMP3373.AAC.1
MRMLKLQMSLQLVPQVGKEWAVLPLLAYIYISDEVTNSTLDCHVTINCGDLGSCSATRYVSTQRVQCEASAKV